MSKLIAPSVLAADFANLQRDVEMINRSDADWFHIDIICLLYTSPSPRDQRGSRMPSSA